MEGFVKLPTKILLDKTLSNNSFRLICYMISKPIGWKFYNSEIEKNIECNVSKCLKELEDKNYIKRLRKKDLCGKFKGGFEYIILPTDEEPKKEIKKEDAVKFDSSFFI